MNDTKVDVVTSTTATPWWPSKSELFPYVRLGPCEELLYKNSCTGKDGKDAGRDGAPRCLRALIEEVCGISDNFPAASETLWEEKTWQVGRLKISN